MWTRRRLGWLTERPIAHRGLHDLGKGRPENSLAAFEAAAQGGYSIECDLHPASDGVPMVFHDDDLRRLCGEAGCLRDRNAADLRRLRLHGTAEGIPTLDDLLQVAGGRTPLVIELKHMSGRDSGFAASVVERLRSYSGPAALMSFDPALIADAKAAGSTVPVGLTAEGDWRTARAHLNTILRLGADFVSYAIDDMPTPLPVFARRALGLPLICWTVRTEEQRRRARTWTDQITFEGFLP